MLPFFMAELLKKKKVSMLKYLGFVLLHLTVMCKLGEGDPLVKSVQGL